MYFNSTGGPSVSSSYGSYESMFFTPPASFNGAKSSMDNLNQGLEQKPSYPPHQTDRVQPNQQENSSKYPAPQSQVLALVFFPKLVNKEFSSYYRCCSPFFSLSLSLLPEIDFIRMCRHHHSQHHQCSRSLRLCLRQGRLLHRAPRQDRLLYRAPYQDRLLKRSSLINQPQSLSHRLPRPLQPRIQQQLYRSQSKSQRHLLQQWGGDSLQALRRRARLATETAARSCLEMEMLTVTYVTAIPGSRVQRQARIQKAS